MREKIEDDAADMLNNALTQIAHLKPALINGKSLKQIAKVILNKLNEQLQRLSEWASLIGRCDSPIHAEMQGA